MTKGVDAMMEDSKAAQREVQEIKGKVAEKKLAKIRAQAALTADKKRAKAEADRAVRAESSKVAKARREAKQKVDDALRALERKKKFFANELEQAKNDLESIKNTEAKADQAEKKRVDAEKKKIARGYEEEVDEATAEGRKRKAEVVIQVMA